MKWRDFQGLQRVAEVRDTFISYLDDGSGTPVVLLHGIPTWSYLWTPVLGRLTHVALSAKIAETLSPAAISVEGGEVQGA